MVQRLLQIRAHLILCFRAEEKIDMVKVEENGKTKIVPKEGPGGFKGWLPICEKNLPYELTRRSCCTPSSPACRSRSSCRSSTAIYFPLDKPITERASPSGRPARRPTGLPASRAPPRVRPCRKSCTTSTP
jgi:hypothetical protein